MSSTTKGRTSAAALAGSVLVHLVVISGLVAGFEAAGSAISEVHELTLVTVPAAPLPPEPVVEPAPAPVEPEPTPEPVRRRSRPRPVATPTEPVEPPADTTTDDTEPEQAPEASDPAVAEPRPPEPDRSSHGGPVLVASSRGMIGVGRSSTPRSPRSSLARRPAFSPVLGSQVAAEPELIGEISPRYPLEARRQYIDGAVRLLVEVRASGGVRGIRVIEDPGGGLAGAAVAELRRARFRPARDRRGAPVDRRIVYTVRFELDD